MQECQQSPAQFPTREYNGPTIVLKRFQNEAPRPIGANYVVDSAQVSFGQGMPHQALPTDSMSQVYAPRSDLSVPLFEAIYDALHAEGYPIWKDYDANPLSVEPPKDGTPYLLVTATVQHLEIDTFTAAEVYEAAGAVLAVRVTNPVTGQHGDFSLKTKLKIVREASFDIIDLLGRSLAAQLADSLTKVQS